MSDKENVLDKTIKDVYDEITYKTDLGQKAQVRRHSVGGDASKYHNENLKRIGLELQKGEITLKEFKYLGSASVHYFQAPMTKTAAFICQAGTMKEVPEILAQDGVTDLRNSMLELYGHNRQKKRSGF